jgi:hypothetical protein
MSVSDLIDWLSRIAALAVGGAAIIILWSLVARRSRARRRCPRCWYDMSGLPGRQCPECGRTARSERRLFRHRRTRTRVLAVVVLSAASYALFITPSLRQGAWITRVPGTVLIAALPFVQPGTPTQYWRSSSSAGGLAAQLSLGEMLYGELAGAR